MAQTLKVRKGDLVQVMTGKDAGKQGRVLEARPSEGRVLVENLNLQKRHMRPRPVQTRSGMAPQMREGGIVTRPGPIDVSNVMVVCPACNKPSRVGTDVRQVKGETVRVRVCKRCGGEIDR